MARRRHTYSPPSLMSYLPFSGNVMQSIFAPWFSPSFTFDYAGDPEIENRVVAEVASYGSQLGWLTDIVLALAEKKSLPSNATDSLNKLREAAKEIAEIKIKVGTSPLDEAKNALDRLQRDRPDAYASLLRERARTK